MAIRRRKWTGKAGKPQQHWEIDVCVSLPTGEKKRVKKKAIVQTRRGAEKEERQIREQIAFGTWGSKEGQKKETATVKQFAKEFMQYCAATNSKGELREKIRTLELHLLPVFGTLRLDELTSAHVEGYKREKLERPQGRGMKPLSPKTVVDHLAVLRRMLNLAKEWGRIDVVPTLKAPRVELPDVEAHMFLDFQEATAIVEAARQKDRGWILFAIRTGLRLGELRGLRWDSLDLDNRAKAAEWGPSMRVSQQLTRDGPSPTKGRRPRTVHLADDLVAILRAQPKRGLYVFTDDEGRPLTRGAIDYAVREAGRRAGLSKPVHPHMLRHTFVSHALMTGVSLAIVQAWAGHADVKMTLRYSHLAASTSAAFARKMATAP